MVFGIILILLLPISGSGTIVQDRATLFITENIVDLSLAVKISESLNSRGDFVDINVSEDLNDLFLNENFLNTYSCIIMILNQMNNHFNETLVGNLENFISEGGIFCIVTSQIWRCSTPFHRLLGMNISSGQKEWPPGNNTESIALTVVNDTYTQSPFQMVENSTFEVQGSIGITTAIDDSYTIATSQDTPNGKATITGFKQQAGFICAVPLGLNEYNSSFIPFSQFLASIISSGIDFQVTSESSSTTYSQETSQPSSSSVNNYPNGDFFPILGISEEGTALSIFFFISFVIALNFKDN